MARITGIDADFVPLNLGGNPFGWTADAPTSFTILDAFAEAGGSFVDTADMYSEWVPGSTGGDSETIIGDWMAARGNRDHIVVATKAGRLSTLKGLAHATVTTALDASLRRLRTDHVDLFYSHGDDPDTPIADQVRAFDALVRAGKIRAIGLSNYSPERLREWVETADALGATRPAAVQPRYSLVTRHEYEPTLAPVIDEFGLAVFPYSTLASGFLSGKYRTGADLTGARAGAAERYLNADGLAVVEALATVAASHDVELTTVALAWLLARGVTAPIASVSRPEQLPALMAATTLQLTGAEVAALDAASAPFA